MQFRAIPLPVLHIENSVISKYILPYLKDNKESRQCKHWKLFNSENFQVADSYYRVTTNKLASFYLRKIQQLNSSKAFQISILLVTVKTDI